MRVLPYVSVFPVNKGTRNTWLVSVRPNRVMSVMWPPLPFPREAGIMVPFDPPGVSNICQFLKLLCSRQFAL